VLGFGDLLLVSVLRLLLFYLWNLWGVIKKEPNAENYYFDLSVYLALYNSDTGAFHY
jgi:hypothetical protein